jgi:hypothetical protein
MRIYEVYVYTIHLVSLGFTLQLLNSGIRMGRHTSVTLEELIRIALEQFSTLNFLHFDHTDKYVAVVKNKSFHQMRFGFEFMVLITLSKKYINFDCEAIEVGNV